MEETITLSDASGVAEARRAAMSLAQSLGCCEICRAGAALVVTEAATNILKYAGRGRIDLRPYRDAGSHGIAMIALDNGPGIASVERAMVDGYSTGGSLGAGLGTIARQAKLLDIYAREGQGTALLAHIGCDKPGTATRAALAAKAQRSLADVGVRSSPKAGQEICGDAWALRQTDGRLWLALLDGLGHGPLAADASRAAVKVFHDATAASCPADILHQAHAALKTTRGAVMAVALFEPERHRVTFAGVGNIVCSVHSRAGSQHLLSTDGTVGYNMRLVRENGADWHAGAVFIASTDGLSTRWNLNRHAGLIDHHPSLIAAVMHRDFGKDSDDATVVVVKAH
ncbi:ATP-binding protein/SpoIIE family protein phosphatase [Robbsia sp. Bb-Pol-6]|uniref:ATP-binding protein/SpoIIE family protein phosphatase n=1 Tax=Robbsia betulipollinis TaxID=2981849 RepID=A0ABT3ZSY9_9BURK|nr:ATP-binding SpoIIE family protein phosphatase [Robbsia betulipollinis]MCY0389387.1 ATP-binding protein/SpoIIE family protein phosphatase [Robbsia betulipollinis]